MAKQEKERGAPQPSLKDQLAASRKINLNISGDRDPEEEEEQDPKKMKVAELKAALTEAGVEFEADANKAALVALLTEHRAK